MIKRPAVQQSGVDPLNMQGTKPDRVAKGPDGSAVKGAAKGAVAGVAIGAIAGDAGKGPPISEDRQFQESVFCMS